MSDHYYSANPASRRDVREVTFTARGRQFTLRTDAGTFSKDGLDPGSALLLASLPRLTGAVLDLGCGWGAMGLTVAAMMPGARVTMSDVNQRSLEMARLNAHSLGVEVNILCSDGFANLPGSYDAILLNPPIRAGKEVTYGLYRGCAEHLAPGGALYVVIRKQQGAESAARYLATLFGEVERVVRQAGYWVLRCAGNASL